MTLIDRPTAEQVLREAIAACDPAIAVGRALMQPVLAARLTGRAVIGVAIGKAAWAMARGAGAVARGVVVVPQLGAGELPAGWSAIVAGHPEPDARSVAAADAVLALVGGAAAGDAVLVLMSGGASALVARPIAGVTLDDKRARVRAAMAAGAPIAELNALRRSLSAIKGGLLARASAAPVTTLASSDVVGDDLSVIGSGPTVPARAGDHAEVIVPMAAFGKAAAVALAERDVFARRRVVPMVGDVAEVADGLAADRGDGVLIAWGEPTVRLPVDPGEGGRAQQLALALARRLRGGARAALVIGSDGVDGPRPRDGREAPAGAYVDGATWDAIAAAGVDADAALARCDAGRALAAVGALVVTGATGVNFADLVLLG